MFETSLEIIMWASAVKGALTAVHNIYPTGKYVN
jgi:hypothetical protein